MKRLSDAELEVMLEIWKADEPICRFELEELLHYKNWATTTILTLLSRLEGKGYVSAKKRGKVKYYIPLVKEEQYCAREGEGLLKKLYGNSITNFVAALTKEESFSREELEELRLFLDEQRRSTEWER